MERFPDNTSAWLEGFPGSGKPSIRRTALVGDIAQKVEAFGSLITNSPSFTGKTSLAKLMYNHWRSHGKHVFFLTFAPLNPGEDLNEYFKFRLGLKVAEVMKSNGFLILDETQNIFNYSAVWGSLKAGASCCKVLAFSVFGLSRAGNDRSPPEFQQKLYYDDIKFSNEECAELVHSFCQIEANNRSILVPEILGDIFQYVNNHPGLVYLALHTLCYEFTRNPYNARKTAEFQQLIVRGELQSVLQNARCFRMTYDKISNILGDSTNETLNTLITVGFLVLPDNEHPLLDLHRYGICIADRQEKLLKFSSGIMMEFYKTQYYKPSTACQGLL